MEPRRVTLEFWSHFIGQVALLPLLSQGLIKLAEPNRTRGAWSSSFSAKTSDVARGLA